MSSNMTDNCFSTWSRHGETSRHWERQKSVPIHQSGLVSESKYILRFLLNDYVGLIKMLYRCGYCMLVFHSGDFKGTQHLLNVCSSCHRSCQVPSKVLQLAVANALYETCVANRRNPDVGCVMKCYLLSCWRSIIQWAWFQGALDKYDIYLFASCSKENFKINPYQKFRPIQPMHFHFIWFLMNSIIPRVSHRPLYYVFIEVDFKK